MCTPDPLTMTLASAALSGAGTYMQSSNAASNAKRAQQAKDQVYRDSAARQAGYAQEAQDAYKPMVQGQGAQGFQDKLAESVGSRTQAFNDARLAPANYTFDLTGAPKNVMLAQEKAFGDKGAQTQRDTNNLAQFGGYATTQNNLNLDRNAYTRAFANLVDKAQGDVRLLPNAMNAAANNSQKSGGLFPTLLKGVGQAGVMYGAAGAPDIGGYIFNGGAGGQIPFGAKDLGDKMPWLGGISNVTL